MDESINVVNGPLLILDKKVGEKKLRSMTLRTIVASDMKNRKVEIKYKFARNLISLIDWGSFIKRTMWVFIAHYQYMLY